MTTLYCCLGSLAQKYGLFKFPLVSVYICEILKSLKSLESSAKH